MSDYASTDDEYAQASPSREYNLPDRLDSPLLETDLDLLDKALHPSLPFPRLKSRLPVDPGRSYINLMRRAGVLAEAHGARRWTAQDTVNLIDRVATARKDFELTWSAATQTYRYILEGLRDRGVRVPHEEPQLNHEDAQLLKNALWLRSTYDRLRATPTEPVSALLSSSTRLVLSRAGVLVRLDDEWIFAPLHFFLAVLGAVESMTNTILGWAVMLPHEYRRRLNGAAVLRIARWQREVILRHGSPGYVVAKAPESLFKAHTSSVSGGDIPGIPEALHDMTEKYRAKETDLGSADHLTPQLVRVIQGFTSITETLEMFGSFHFCGYPIIDPVMCGRAALNKSLREDESSAMAIMQSARLLKHLLIKGHIKRKGAWPPCQWEPNTPPDCRARQLALARYLNVSDTSYPLEDLDYVSFRKVEEFDYRVDYIADIQDKACFEGLQARQTRYDSNVPPEKTRLLLNVLSRNDHDNQALMEQYASESLPPDGRGARDVVKECEYKVKPDGGGGRLYVTQSPEFRRCASLCNENIKSGVLPYLPYTSMNLTAQQIEKILRDSASPIPGFFTAHFDLDFSDWNSRFLQAIMHVTGKILDDWFGVKGYYGKIHDHFKKFEFGTFAPGMKVESLEHPELRDQRVSNDTTRYNDSTGNEGIAQREWTVLTTLMVYLTLWGTGHTFTILGSGDNQIMFIHLRLDREDQVGPEVLRIKARLQEVSQERNHDSKPEETTISRTFAFYGKQPVGGGRQYGVLSKFASKIGPTSSELTPTFPDSLGAIMSGALGVARVAETSITAYLLGLIHLVLYLRRCSVGHSRYGATVSELSVRLLNPQTFTAMMFAPSILGGMPFPSWSNFLWSHDPCPLTQVISELRATRRCPVSVSIANALLDDRLYTPNPDLDTLLDAPYGLPIRVSAVPTNVVREATMSYLTHVPNEDVRSLAVLSTATKEPLRAALVAQRPLHPLIVGDMLAISSLGKAEKVVSKFKSSGTMGRTVMNGSLRASFRSRAQRRERGIVEHLELLVSFPSVPYPWAATRSLVIATQLRLRWGPPGTLAGLGTEAPLDFPIVTTRGPGLIAHMLPGRDVMSKGRYEPYSGSKTMEHRTEPLYTFEEVAGLSDLRKLVLSVTAGAVDPGVYAQYEAIAATRTPIPLAQLIEYLPGIEGGSPSHRYEPLSGGGLIAPIGNSGRRTHVTWSSDHIPGLSASGRDCAVTFQSFISYLVWAAAQAPPSVTTMRIALNGDMFDDLEDAPRTLPVQTMPELIRLEGNPLSTVPTLLRMRTTGRVEGVDAPPAQFSATTILTCILFNTYVGTQGGGAVTDLHESSIFVDVPAMCAVNGRVLYHSLSNAVAMIAIWYTVTITHRQDLRHDLFTVCTNSALSLTGGFRAVLTNDHFDKSWLIRQGLLEYHAGPAGMASTLREFAGAVAYRAFTQATNLEAYCQMMTNVCFPRVNRGNLVGFSARYRLTFLVWGWILHTPAQVIGQAKTQLRRMLAEIASVENGDIVADALSIPTVQAVSDGFRALTPEENESLARLTDTLSAPLLIAFPSVQSAWRHLRTLRRENFAPMSIALQGVIPTGSSLFPATLLTQAGAASYPARLGPQPPGRTPAQVFTDRIGRVAGIRTTTGHLWSPLLRRAPGPILVVGAGAGGIQAMAAAMGKVAFGLELCERLPVELLTAPELVVPESFPEAPSHYTGRCLEGGSWWNVGVRAVQDGNWRTIILDIEDGENRHGLELIDPMVEAGYTGHVMMRLFLGKNECEAICSQLLASTGIRHLRAYPLSHVSHCCIPWILTFDLRHTFRRLADRGSPIFLTGLTGPAMNDAGLDRATYTRRALHLLTGGVIVVDDVRAAIAALETIRDNARVSRATTQGNYLLTLARAWMAMIRAQRATDVENYLTTTYEREQWGTVWIDPDDEPLQYMMEKIIPRLWNLLRQD